MTTADSEPEPEPDPAGDGFDPTVDASADATVDPTRVREQPALTTSTAAIWLIVGALFAAVSLGVLIPMSALPSGTVAVVAAIIVAVLYLGMVAVRFAVPSGRRRLGMLAVGMLLMAAVALGAVLIVASASWNAVGA